MKKAELIETFTKYNMEFMREPITKQGIGAFCRVNHAIPDLDKVVEDNRLPVVGTRVYLPDGEIEYKIYCPSQWIDLWGWC